MEPVPVTLIINEVASAISKFRTYAEECGIGQQWIAAVETCLNNHLSDWGFLPESSSPSFEIDGILYENVRVEQTYKGNFHLLCEIQGKERIIVITKNKEEYAYIQETGYFNLSTKQLENLVKKYLVR